MKLFILIVFILSLCSCSSNDTISHSIYIASLGFEKNDDNYSGYFLLPSSLDVGPQQATGETNIAIIEGDSLVNIFMTLFKTSSLKINLKHVSSIVLHESMLNNNDINSLIDYVKKSPDLDFNFHLFTTKEKIDEIYKIKNPNNESMILTVLVEPIYTRYSYFTAKPIHFLNFCRDFYNKKTIKIPYVELHSIWGENDLISASGITYLTDGEYASISSDDNPTIFLNSYDILEYSDDNYNVIFHDYKCSINKSKIKITSDCLFVGDGDIDSLSNVINEKIEELITDYSYLDFLNFNYYGYSYNNVDISISLRLKQ